MKGPKPVRSMHKLARDGKGKMAKGGRMKKEGADKGGASRAKKKEGM